MLHLFAYIHHTMYLHTFCACAKTCIIYIYIHIQLPAENGLAGVSGVARVFASPPFWTHQKLESQSR